MNLSDVFKQSVGVQLGAAGTVGLTAVALWAGYSGHLVMEEIAAFATGLSAGATLLQVKTLMDGQAKKAGPEKNVESTPKME